MNYRFLNVENVCVSGPITGTVRCNAVELVTEHDQTSLMCYDLFHDLPADDTPAVENVNPRVVGIFRLPWGSVLDRNSDPVSAFVVTPQCEIEIAPPDGSTLLLDEGFTSPRPQDDLPAKSVQDRIRQATFVLMGVEASMRRTNTPEIQQIHEDSAARLRDMIAKLQREQSALRGAQP